MEFRPIRVLVSAFAPVPGTNPHSTALLGMASALVGELDLVTVKTEALSYLDTLQGARMFRVPVGEDSAVEMRDTFARAVLRQLESRPYDAVHVRSPTVGRRVADRKSEMKFRLIYEVATFPDESDGPDAERRWEDDHDAACEAADLILVPTEAGARAHAERGHGGKVAIVAPGVDVDDFDWWPVAGDSTLRILYLGTFEAERGVETLLEALREVRKHWHVDVLIAGDNAPHRRERLRRMVGAFSLGSVVRQRGEPRPGSVPMIIGAADVCVATASAAPRFQEFGDLPQPLLEYLACRRPVVAAGVPGVAEIVRDEREALLYPPDDGVTLADSIVQVASEPVLRERLVEAAYERTRWRYSAGARRRRLAEVYESLFSGSQGFDPWEDGFDPSEPSVATQLEEKTRFRTVAATRHRIPSPGRALLRRRIGLGRNGRGPLRRTHRRGPSCGQRHKSGHAPNGSRWPRRRGNAGGDEPP